MEAAIDPLLCHFQGPISTLLRRGNMYGPEPTDTYAGETYGYGTLDIFIFLVYVGRSLFDWKKRQINIVSKHDAIYLSDIWP